MISIVINLDTRPGVDEDASSQSGNLNGTRSYDFFIDGIMNKIKFFDGHEIEVTVYVDLHKRLPPLIRNQVVDMQSDGTIDNLILARHSEKYLGNFFPKWNDMNFLNALTMAHGDYICHFDGDMSAFINDKDVVTEWLQWLDERKYDFISYPSPYSPGPAIDPKYKSYWWASTRFFICKAERIDYTEIVKCLSDSEYLYGKYGGEGEPRNPWLEHILGLMTSGQDRVFYPPINPKRCLIFSWAKYHTGVLPKLNSWPYEKLFDYIKRIKYPCDVVGEPL